MGAWRPAKWKFFADEYGFRMCSPFRLGSRGERRSSQEICFPNPTAKTSQLGPVLCDGRNSSEKERRCVWTKRFRRKKIVFLFFRAHRTNDLTKKLEKVGPFECDELERHCRVSAKCYPTKVPALYTMIKKFNSVFLVLLLVGLLTQIL